MQIPLAGPWLVRSGSRISARGGRLVMDLCVIGWIISDIRKHIFATLKKVNVSQYSCEEHDVYSYIIPHGADK